MPPLISVGPPAKVRHWFTAAYDFYSGYTPSVLREEGVRRMFGRYADENPMRFGPVVLAQYLIRQRSSDIAYLSRLRKVLRQLGEAEAWGYASNDKVNQIASAAIGGPPPWNDEEEEEDEWGE